MTAMTPMQVFQKTAELGLKLGIRADKLTVQPIEACPLGFLKTLRAYKGCLLCMLSWPFVMIDSKALGETIFLVQDEDTKAALVEAGASPWSTYTRDELRVLVAQSRAKPFLPDELCKLHEIKRMFNARIARP